MRSLQICCELIPVGSNSDMKYVNHLRLFQDLLKTDTLQRGRLLGLDVGDKYVGLAVSDPHNKIASPLRFLGIC